jgi:hypothetical protein
MQNDPNKEIAKLFLEARDAPPNPVAVANAFHPHALQPLNAVEARPTKICPTLSPPATAAF